MSRYVNKMKDTSDEKIRMVRYSGCQALDRTITSLNIKIGLKKTGIYSNEKTIFSDEEFMHSK